MKEKQTAERARKNYIIESNNLAQTKQNDLTTQQMKIVLFFISKIRMTDDGTQDYTATIGEICDICGLDKTSGAYYINIKNDLIRMTQREWARIKSNIITTISWFSDVEIHEGSGRVTIHFHEKLWPDLFNLRQNFTKFALGEVLPFKSKYAIRLYQIIVSKIMGREERQLDLMQTIEINFEAEELKQMLNAGQYKNNNDFKRFAIDAAVKQINKYSEEIRIDNVIIEKDGQRMKTIIFAIRYATTTEGMKAKKAAQEAMTRKRKRKAEAAAE